MDFTKFYMQIRNVVDSTSGVLETINWKQTSNFTGVRIRIFAFLGSDHHIFQRIGTKFPTELKLSNADFVLSSVVNETRDTNRILGMCKCRFILVHSIDARDAHSIEHSDACLFLIPPSRPNNINNNNN